MKRVIVRSVNLSIWIIPLVSLIVGGWLIYKYYMNLGPIIEIEFENSGGLEPKKSVVKFRDVKVGVVEDVILLKKGVLVKVRMHKDAKPYLNPTTKFWIVKPRIEAGKVSGIEALFSGPYIQMEAKYSGFLTKKFKGFETPPIEWGRGDVKIIKLVSDNSYGLSEKMPVYFKGEVVGNIRNVLLKKDSVNIYVSIKNRYTKFINDSTRFWNIRGVDVTFNKDNLQFKVPSLSELVVGGIEFTTLEDVNLTKKSFRLYGSRSEAFENRLGGMEYQKAIIKIVDDKNGKLRVGNGVFFRDFRVGYVEYLESELKNFSITTLVHIKINDAFKDLKEAIKNGLKAKVVSSGILGGVRIELFFSGRADVSYCKGKILIPFKKVKEVSLVAKMEKFLDKLNSLPIKETLKKTNNLLDSTNSKISKTLIKANKVLNNLDDLIKNSKTLLNTITKNIENLTNSYNKDSSLYKNLNNTILNVNDTLLKINQTLNIYQKVGKKIDNKPNSLILGD